MCTHSERMTTDKSREGASEWNVPHQHIQFTSFQNYCLSYPTCDIFLWQLQLTSIGTIITSGEAVLHEGGWILSQWWKKYGCGWWINLWKSIVNSSVVHFSHSVTCNSLTPHGLQDTKLPCPSPNPGAWSDSCPSSWWCHPTISCSVIPFSFHLQSFPASGSFPVSQFFASGGQSIGASASASVFPMNIQDWFPLGWTGWITLQSKGLYGVFSNITVQKHQFFGSQLSLWSNSYPYMTTGKTIALTIWTFVGKVMSLLFNILSRFVIAFLPRSKRLLISCLPSPSAVILETKKIKSVTVSIVSPYLCHKVMGPDAMILVFWLLSFKPAFSLSSFTFIKRLIISSLLSAIRVLLSAYLRLLIFHPAILILACALSSPAFCMMYSAFKLNK